MDEAPAGDSIAAPPVREPDAIRFAIAEPSEENLGRMAGLAPDNPFRSPAYVRARQAAGERAAIATLRHGHELVVACPVFVRGHLGRRLEMPSAPNTVEHVFWTGLIEHCRRARVATLAVNTFASPAARIPRLHGEMSRRQRHEIVLRLGDEPVFDRLSSNHRRNVQRARKAGLGIRRTTSEAACRDHVRVMQASADRRAGRAGDLARPESWDVDYFATMLRHGAAELFQATSGDAVVASVLVLKADRGAYYQSAGTSPEGMALGASHFLILAIAEQLQSAGIEVFNLGGVDEASDGLARFKLGFGGESIPLQAVSVQLAGLLRRRLASAWRLARTDPRTLLRDLSGRRERYVAYSADPKTIPAPDRLPGAMLEKLADDSLLELSRAGPDLAVHADRLQRHGFNDAWAVRIEGRLAHVAWLIAAEHDRRLPRRNVRLRDGEAEITHCFTLPEFRGQGVYVFAIRSLCRIAAMRDVRRVFMITSIQNVASQRGIERAGFHRCGRIVRWSLPYLSSHRAVTVRTHRW
jgi:RimJ/RimL family protein N-acetyltransferase